MKERASLPSFNELWASHVRASTAPRMTDDQAEQDFWTGFMAKKTGYAPDPSSRQVVAELLRLMKDHGVETALEFGPGWGNYTLDLAKACREVACVDISQAVLDFIDHIGAERGLRNLSFHHVKWEDFAPERQYDLVFGYNCYYRQEDLAACFAKMNRIASKLCVVGMNTGLAPSWFHELEAQGAQVKWEWKDYIYFVGVLYQMGIDPNVRILPFTKELVYPDTGTMVARECARLAPGTYDPKLAEEILLTHFHQDPDGKLRAQSHFRSAMVWWRPNP